MKIGKRYEAIYRHKYKCSSFLEEIYVPVYFSFEVFDIQDDSAVVGNFLPPGVEFLLKNKKFFFVKEFIDDENVRVIESRLEKIESGGGFKICLEETVIRERRLFDRFFFCPEMLGKWKFGGFEREAEAYIVDISLKGVRFFIPNVSASDIHETFPFIMRKGSKIIELSLVRVTPAAFGCFLAGQISYTNFNIVRFIINNYVKLLKNILP